MDSRERYGEVHADYMKAMYNLLITDTKRYEEVSNAVSRLVSAAFDFGAEFGARKDVV